MEDTTLNRRPTAIEVFTAATAIAIGNGAAGLALVSYLGSNDGIKLGCLAGSCFVGDHEAIIWGVQQIGA